jgi:hypothetical protein
VVEKKRGNGEGGKPRQRPDGRWETRYYVDGMRRSVYGKTRREVATKLVDALASKDEPAPLVPMNVMVREFLAQYENVAKDRCTPPSHSGPSFMPLATTLRRQVEWAVRLPGSVSQPSSLTAIQNG